MKAEAAKEEDRFSKQVVNRVRSKQEWIKGGKKFALVSAAGRNSLEKS